MKYILLTLFIFNAYSSAIAIDIQRHGEHLVLKGSSCYEVSSTLESLKLWTKQVDPGKSCTALPQLEKESECTVTIDNCVPDHVLKYQGVSPEKFGPNCWNLALVMKGILPALRYSTAEEMSFYMSSPLCRQLAPLEKRLPGDVGAVRNVGDQDEEVHGFIYISEDLAYSKNGPEEKSPFAVQSLQEVLKTYEVPNKNECRGNVANKNLNCGNALSVFRCKSLDSYLQETKGLPETLAKSIKNLDNVEKCVQQEVVEGSPLSDQSRKSLVDVANVLVSYLEDKRTSVKSNLSEEEKFTITALQLRLDALVNQFANNGDEDFAKEVSRFSNKLKYSARELSR